MTSPTLKRTGTWKQDWRVDRDLETGSRSSDRTCFRKMLPVSRGPSSRLSQRQRSFPSLQQQQPQPRRPQTKILRQWCRPPPSQLLPERRVTLEVWWCEWRWCSASAPVARLSSVSEPEDMMTWKQMRFAMKTSDILQREWDKIDEFSDWMV